MIVRAIDGRFLGHPFIFSIEKERPWQRLSPRPESRIGHRRSLSLRVGPRRFLCRGPTLSVWAPRSLCRAPALCQASALSVSGPGALCRASALLSGPGAPCSGPGSLGRGSVWGFGGSGALCVESRRSLCRASALSGSGPNTLSVGPGALCVGARRCSLWACPFALRRAGRSTGALRVGPRSSLRRLCVGSQRFLCRAPTLSVSGPSAPCLVSGPALSVSGLCWGARLQDVFVGMFVRDLLSVSDPAALYVGPSALHVGPGALCVRSRHSLCRAPPLPGVLLVGRHSLALCVGPSTLWLFALGSGPAAQIRVFILSPIRSAGPHPHVPARIRVPPIRPASPRSACLPSSPARSLFPGEIPKPYHLGERERYNVSKHNITWYDTHHTTHMYVYAK